MISRHVAVRPLPVILPALRDELLSSWIQRHAEYYGVSGGRMLRHLGSEALSLRQLDFELTRGELHQLCHMFRCSHVTIRKMTQVQMGACRKAGLIATSRPMQVCGRCSSRHNTTQPTRGARLRSWMEGWRVACPVCQAPLEDVRPCDLLTKASATEPLLIGAADNARHGELLMDRSLSKPGQVSQPLIELMRILLLPRSPIPGYRPFPTTIPRLLNVVVPGFDRYLHDHHPDFHRPATLLLTMSIRIPVLAGVFKVATQPSYWAERLLSTADRRDWKRLVACVRTLATSGSQISRKPEIALACKVQNWGSSERDFLLIAA
jgi:hypothetical protein